MSSSGELMFDDQAWSMLIAQPNLEVEFLDQPALSPITREDVCRYDALLIKRSPVDGALMAADSPGELRLRLLARNGVSFDHIDVEASTRAGGLIHTTPHALARPVASSVMAMMLAFFLAGM